MLNISSQNCGTCGFNRSLKVVDGFLQSVGQGHCNIRDVAIADPFRTYCLNWFSLSRLLKENVDRDKSPRGPILALGIYEVAHCTVPWHDRNEPRVISRGRCYVCNNTFNEGIEVDADDGTVRKFCCCAHYLRWWSKLHPETELPKGFDLGYYRK